MKSMNLFSDTGTKSSEASFGDNKPKEREHSKEFKELAVNLASKIGVTKAAEELGVSTSSIYSWQKTLGTSTLAKNPLVKKLLSAPLQDEIGNLIFSLEGKIYSLNVYSEEDIERVKEEVNANSLTKYDWFKEETGLYHLVLYNTEMYEIVNEMYIGQYLHYKKDCNLAPIIPINATSCYKMFSNCKSLTQLDLSSLDTSNVTNMSGMFRGCFSLLQLDLGNFDTSNVTDMYEMFWGCEALTQLDLSSFNISKVTDMYEMFWGCEALTKLDLSNFDTSKVINMENMFRYCSSLTQLDLSNFKTSSVNNMSSMFCNCTSLTQLDLSSFDTSKVTDMGGMFHGCEALTKLDLSSFNTSNVTDISSMFSNCEALTQLDISNFNTSQVTKMYCMFKCCKKLTTIYISNKWRTYSIKESVFMFDHCNSLQNFNPEKIGIEMAKPIEKGGYLTLKK